MPTHSLHSRSRRGGNYAVIFAITVPALLGMSAIAVDLSYQKVVRAELQGASDIAAAAGAAQLDGSYDGLTNAKNAAIRAAARNNADGVAVPLQPGDIEYGFWDLETWEWIPSDDPAEIDAMRVTVTREGVSTSFASVAFADHDMRAQARTTALAPTGSPAGSVSCYLPLAVPECLFDQYSADELSELRLYLNPSGVDNVGWGRVGGSPNASWTRDQLSNCEADGVASIGDDAGLQNGVVSSALFEMIDVIEGSDTTWDTESWGPIPAQNSKSALGNSYGNTLEGAIIVFDGGEDYCEGNGGNYNGYETITGFVWAAVYDVRTSGGAKKKNIWVKLDPYADEAIGLSGGGHVDGGVVHEGATTIVQ